MRTKIFRLKTPLGEEVLKLKAGDHVELSGIVYTARDEAHLRMQEKGIPFDPKGAVIYHCGPVIHEGNVIAAGPTTSARMNEISGFLIDNGVRALIGKGGMGATVQEPAPGPWRVPCLYRWLCSSCIVPYETEGSVLRGSRDGRGCLGNRTRFPPACCRH